MSKTTNKNDKTINRLTKYRDAISAIEQEIDREELKLPYPESSTIQHMLLGIVDELSEHAQNLEDGNYDEQIADFFDGEGN
jgi:NTP pyrophosphatase (non-canonical NTP hydrolase)